MLKAEIYDEIKKATPEERVEILEYILRSLKIEFMTPKKEKPQKMKKFKVKKIDLGEDVSADREEIYSKRS